MHENASTVNETLSEYAVGFMASRESSLLDFVAPVVPTGVTKGDYKHFDESQGFEEYDTEIPAGSEAPTIRWNAEDKAYRCKPNGLKIPSLDEEEAAAKEPYRQIIQNNKLATLLSTQLVNRERRGFKKILDSLTPEADMGQWTGTTGGDADVIGQFDDLIERINNNTGRMPGFIGLGLSAWKVIKNHPQIIGRFGGLNAAVTPELFASLLINPQITVKVGSMPYNTAPQGLAPNKKGIVGMEVLVFHKEASPVIDDMSACKTFSVESSLITGVYTIREDLKHIAFDEVRWSEDIKVTAPISIARIHVS